MSLTSFIRDFSDGFKIGYQHIQFREMLEMDRDRACVLLGELVQRFTPEELDAFEQNFLTHSIAVIGNKYRLRAMELYAVLKIREMAHYNEFRGFFGSSDAL